MELKNAVYLENDEPLCERRGCFACRNGVCEILTDNDFGDRECPFFKLCENLDT